MATRTLELLVASPIILILFFFKVLLKYSIIMYIWLSHKKKAASWSLRTGYLNCLISFYYRLNDKVLGWMEYIKIEKNTLFFWPRITPAATPPPPWSSWKFHSFSKPFAFPVSPFSPSLHKYFLANQGNHPLLLLSLSSVRIWGAVFQVYVLPTSRANLCRL